MMGSSAIDRGNTTGCQSSLLNGRDQRGYNRFADGNGDRVALCDVNGQNLEAAAKQHPKARLYKDFRKLLEQKDLDAVVIAAPDHWHGVMTVHACEAGKDVYVEKPLATSIAEGRAMRDAARKLSDRLHLL